MPVLFKCVRPALARPPAGWRRDSTLSRVRVAQESGRALLHRVLLQLANLRRNFAKRPAQTMSCSHYESYDLQSIGEVQTGPGTHEALLDTYETPALCVRMCVCACAWRNAMAWRSRTPAALALSLVAQG